jgi:hypothetical protein
MRPAASGAAASMAATTSAMETAGPPRFRTTAPSAAARAAETNAPAV